MGHGMGQNPRGNYGGHGNMYNGNGSNGSYGTTGYRSQHQQRQSNGHNGYGHYNVVDQQSKQYTTGMGVAGQDGYQGYQGYQVQDGGAKAYLERPGYVYEVIGGDGFAAEGGAVNARADDKEVNGSDASDGTSSMATPVIDAGAKVIDSAGGDLSPKIVTEFPSSGDNGAAAGAFNNNNAGGGHRSNHGYQNQNYQYQPRQQQQYQPRQQHQQQNQYYQQSQGYSQQQQQQQQQSQYDYTQQQSQSFLPTQQQQIKQMYGHQMQVTSAQPQAQYANRRGAGATRAYVQMAVDAPEYLPTPPQQPANGYNSYQQQQPVSAYGNYYQDNSGNVAAMEYKPAAPATGYRVASTTQGVYAGAGVNMVQSGTVGMTAVALGSPAATVQSWPQVSQQMSGGEFVVLNLC
jgi:hypothetical protein